MKTCNTIELELKKRGIRPVDIADASGFSVACVAQVVQRKSHNRVIQDIIADILEINPETLWGLDYSPKAKKAIRLATFERKSKAYQVHRLDRPGDRLRKLRYERQMSLDVLFEITGIDKTALNRYENGIRRMSRKTIERISLGLGIDPDWIQFGNTVTKQPASPVAVAEDRCSDSSYFPPSTGSVLPSSGGGTSKKRRTRSEIINCQRAI